MKLVTNDPRWFWQATFLAGATATFYADSKELATDHAHALARDFNTRVTAVRRVKHTKDVTAEENAEAGRLHLMR